MVCLQDEEQPDKELDPANNGQAYLESEEERGEVEAAALCAAMKGKGAFLADGRHRGGPQRVFCEAQELVTPAGVQVSLMYKEVGQKLGEEQLGEELNKATAMVENADLVAGKPILVQNPGRDPLESELGDEDGVAGVQRGGPQREFCEAHVDLKQRARSRDKRAHLVASRVNSMEEELHGMELVEEPALVVYLQDAEQLGKEYKVTVQEPDEELDFQVYLDGEEQLGKELCGKVVAAVFSPPEERGGPQREFCEAKSAWEEAALQCRPSAAEVGGMDLLIALVGILVKAVGMHQLQEGKSGALGRPPESPFSCLLPWSS